LISRLYLSTIKNVFETHNANYSMNKLNYYKLIEENNDYKWILLPINVSDPFEDELDTQKQIPIPDLE